MTALQLFGVAHLDGTPRALPASVTTIAVRDLVALVTEVPYTRVEPTESDVEQHRTVIETVFPDHPVLPAPVGVIFRSQESLVRWMELHYPTLSDGLAFIDDRQVARVHIRRADAAPDDGVDLAAVAAEIFRALRRQAVAAVPLRTEHLTGIVLSAAFLVDRDYWRSFTDAVDGERSQHVEMDIQQTGPWPPYDFVHMQLGG